MIVSSEKPHSGEGVCDQVGGKRPKNSVQMVSGIRKMGITFQFGT
jgi:hypothetical protein